MRTDTTTSVEGAGKKDDIQPRVRELCSQNEETTSNRDREKLQERLAKLVGGVAVVKVGAATETEMKERKARVEDALHATHAAVEEGIVAKSSTHEGNPTPTVYLVPGRAERRSKRIIMMAQRPFICGTFPKPPSPTRFVVVARYMHHSPTVTTSQFPIWSWGRGAGGREAAT